MPASSTAHCAPPLVYADRAARFGDAAARAGRVVLLLSSMLRVGTVAAAVLGAASFLNYGAVPACLIGLLLVAPLAALLVIRDRKQQELRRVEQLRIINEEMLARIERRWDDLPVCDVPVPEPFAGTAADLEIYGPASLFQLVCTAETPAGVDTLARWLAEAALPDVIALRQRAVAELAPQLERRQDLQCCGRLLAGGRSRPARFLEWTEAPRPRFLNRAMWLARGSSLLAALLVVALCAGFGPVEANVFALGAIVAAHLLVTVVLGGRVYDAFQVAALGAAHARWHRLLFQIAARFSGRSPRLAELAAQAGLAATEMARLERLAELSNLRRWWAAYFPLQFLCLWDLHVLDLMERWKSRSGRQYRMWLAAIGELEALCSLAGLACDNPDWAFPQIVDGAATIEAEAIGHPLLPASVRVVNDVSLGPSGQLLMVTGSNMSGKSTLLRSLGTNLVLAQAGGPVCARRMTLPPIELLTVMRVADSLQRGVSLFMAELERLRHVVECADRRAGRPERQVCFLLDEILHGTNSAERHIACAHVLERLVASGAIGAVSTHDLELCRATPIAGSIRPVHFRESIEQDDGRVRMTFDYRLRPGMASTTNVTYLLEAVGLARHARVPAV